MSWIDSVLSRAGLERKPLLSAESSPWTDVGATTAEPPAIRKPINIKRTMLRHPLSLYTGDLFNVEITQADETGRVLSKEKCPEFEIERPMTVDSVTKFEVIDEFGVDVGIGFVLGQSRVW